MAFDNQDWKLYPEDEHERAIGIKLPLNRLGHGRPVDLNYSSGSLSGTHVFVSSYTTEDQAISNLINLILTRKGERIMQPDYGTPVPDFVFEQNTFDNRFRLESDLRQDIEFWLPYIILGRLEVGAGSSASPGDPMHSLTISIPFKVTEQGANRTVTFFVGIGGTSVDII